MLFLFICDNVVLIVFFLFVLMIVENRWENFILELVFFVSWFYILLSSFLEMESGIEWTLIFI